MKQNLTISSNNFKRYLLFIFVLLTVSIQAIGPKKFYKEDWYWCRDRETHPGRQCCTSANTVLSPLEIPMVGQLNSGTTEVFGYGTDCRTTCECNTILPSIKCNKDSECKAKVGPYFKCIKGKCEFPCTADSDCEAKFGYGKTADKGLYVKSQYICGSLGNVTGNKNQKFCKLRDLPKTDEKNKSSK